MRHAITLAALVLCFVQSTNVCAEDASVEQVLERWQTAISSVQVYEASFTRLTYDHVFRVRKQAVGEVRLETPHVGRLSVRPDDIPADPVQRKLDLNGKIYKIRPDRAEIWEWNAERLKQTDPDTGASEEIPIERQSPNWWWITNPSIVLGFDAYCIRTDCDCGLVAKPDSEVIVLTATPRAGSELAKQFGRLDVQLGKQTCLPRAVRLAVADGSFETVYIYSDVRVTSRDEPQPQAPSAN